MNLKTKLLFSIFLLNIFDTSSSNQAKIDSDEIIQFLLNNQEYLETIDNEQLIQVFKKTPFLKKFLVQDNLISSNRIKWNELLKDKLAITFIQKSIDEKTRYSRDISNLFDQIKNIFKNFINQILGLPDCVKLGLKYSTEKSKLPDKINWFEIRFGKELLNKFSKTIVIAGGKNPISDQKWQEFKPTFPYQKNINRNLLFQKTFFYRSPNTNVNCSNETCIKEVNYKSYTWIELASAICMTYIPTKQDGFNPLPGYLASSTIQKCQAIYYENEIYQLTDNKGNFYVMHAFENNKPDLSVILPANWTLSKLNLTEPLIVAPFGGNNDCYFNILRDNFGQGYHQYIYADKYYPS